MTTAIAPGAPERQPQLCYIDPKDGKMFFVAPIGDFFNTFYRTRGNIVKMASGFRYSNTAKEAQDHLDFYAYRRKLPSQRRVVL